MKRKGLWLSAGLTLLILLTTALLLCENRGEGDNRKTSMRIGVLLYRGDDTFISTLRAALEEQVKQYEKEYSVKVTLDIRDAKGNQNTQNSQAERLISLGCDALCVNMVDRAAASVVIDKAVAAGIPVVFFNREPVEEDLNRWDRLYYVGVDPRESAALQGQILVDAYKEKPETLDLNGDGLVSYVLLEGETSHQDSLIRTQWSIQTLKDGNVPLEKITGGIANWERSQASALMEQWIKEYPGQIELVICNNDDMALGAIDALERNGLLTAGIRVVGIDGTPAGRAAFRAGSLFGTVEADTEIYAKAIFDIVSDLVLRKETEYEKYFWTPQRAVSDQEERLSDTP